MKALYLGIDPGMSGGIAYVLDEDGSFASRCNLSMVSLEPVLSESDQFLAESELAAEGKGTSKSTSPITSTGPSNAS